MTLTVASFFWVDPERQKRRRTAISPEDVRIWDRMVARHLKVPHRRVCVTDRPDLVDFKAWGSDAEVVPLDRAKHVPGTCTVKLMAHKPGAVAPEGARLLLMDVDCVVVRALDPLVERDEPMVFWRNPNYAPGGRRAYYQGSLQLVTVGATRFLYDEFDPASTLAALPPRFGGAEQRWISERLNTAYPEAGTEWREAFWDESNGVYGAGRLADGKMGAGVQSVLPDNARIVFFPGDRSVREPAVQRAHPWIAAHYR